MDKKKRLIQLTEGKYIYWEISIDANHRLLLFSSKYRKDSRVLLPDSFCGSRRISYIVLSFQLFFFILCPYAYACQRVGTEKSVWLFSYGTIYITFR